MIELDVRRAFAAERWKEITREVRGCTAAFLSSDMLIAVLATSSVAEAAVEYPQVQQALKEARVELQRPIDAYLLLVVPSVSADDYPHVRKALDDPLICRKAVIELGNADPSSALLRQFPLLADTPEESPQVTHDVVREPGPEELDLLDRNSAENIVDDLLATARNVERDNPQ
ncbi:MAG TPA: hypothetical protein VEK57_03655 [Thermoanaerobaculia bacterium]|nr:hypothetical protein [Thermoanaerobaculia bacterium]